MVTEVSNRDEGMFKMGWEVMGLVCSWLETRKRYHGRMGGFYDAAIRQCD
jgi:hypothetical protein